jgi:uncharacterized glyoxalase superfamily protein PhnB
MPDAFEALRMPLTPVQPDPAFAARLKARVARELGLSQSQHVPGGTTMTSAPSLVPYLAVADGRRALEWYVDVLGARRRGEPIIMPDGRLGHAELDMGESVLYLADEFPELNVVAPRADSGTSVSLSLQVESVDATVERAARAGATVERPPADEFYGRTAGIRDPFGHRWLLQSPLQIASEDRLRHGDVAYASLWVRDVDRAAGFFADVLGWRYAEGGDAAGRQVEGAAPRHGMFGGQPRATLFCCYVVDDVDAAVERVRAAGGQAETPDDRPYGRLAECTDQDGLRFALMDSREAGRRPSAGDAQPGDLWYITMAVRDSARARDFYGAVLGWRFSPGSVNDGWNVEDVAPVTGMWGSREQSVNVPMYLVDDIQSAVERVRARGGTASDVSTESFGLMSECQDDQGTPFYLGQSTS